MHVDANNRDSVSWILWTGQTTVCVYLCAFIYTYLQLVRLLTFWRQTIRDIPTLFCICKRTDTKMWMSNTRGKKKKRTHNGWARQTERHTPHLLCVAITYCFSYCFHSFGILSAMFWVSHLNGLFFLSKLLERMAGNIKTMQQIRWKKRLFH